MKTSIFGPYGNYEAGTVGATLNKLCEQECIPLSTVERLTVGNGKLYDGEKLFGVYSWQDDNFVFLKHE